MMNRFTYPGKRFLMACACCILFLIVGSSAEAQVVIRPSLGLQTMTFNGDVPVSQPISPGPGQVERLGGGITGPQSGARLQFEVFDEESDLLRFPLSVEYYGLSGRTTFSLSTASIPRKQRLTFTHSANIASIGAGAMIVPFDLPAPYLLAEMKFNYISENNLHSRIFYSDNNETVQENNVKPANSATRIGAYVRLGAQLEFFEPLLLDVSAGFGALNLFGKETDPATQRNLLIVDNQRIEPEQTISYFGLNLSLIWKL